eukprot:scaffold479_cov119-Isochrysis_galbana.AAC.6
MGVGWWDVRRRDGRTHRTSNIDEPPQEHRTSIYPPATWHVHVRMCGTCDARRGRRARRATTPGRVLNVEMDGCEHLWSQRRSVDSDIVESNSYQYQLTVDRQGC